MNKSKQRYYGVYCSNCGLIHHVARYVSPEYDGFDFRSRYIMTTRQNCMHCDAKGFMRFFTAYCIPKKDGMPKLAGLRKELGAKVWMV